MKINVKELKNAVENCALISPRKGSLPVIQLIRLEGRKNTLTLHATNLEEHYRAVINVEVGESFSTMAVTEQFLKVLKHVKTESLEIKVERNAEQEVEKLHLTSDMVFRINVEKNVDDFPDFPAEGMSYSASVNVSNKKALFEIMKKISFCTTKLNVNRAYSGILFSQKEDHLDLVATDIHRLSVVRTNVAGTKADFVIPVDSVKNVLKIFDSPVITSVTLDREQMDSVEKGKVAEPVLIRIKTENEHYCSRLLKNEFPNYERVIDLKIIDDGGFEIDKKTAMEKLKTIIEFHSTQKVVDAAFDFVNDRLYLTATGAQRDVIETDMPVKPVNEREDAIKALVLNVKYVHEALMNMDNVRMNLEEGKVLKPFSMLDQHLDYRFYHLIMPLRMEGLMSRKEKMPDKTEMKKAS